MEATEQVVAVEQEAGRSHPHHRTLPHRLLPGTSGSGPRGSAQGPAPRAQTLPRTCVLDQRLSFVFALDFVTIHPPPSAVQASFSKVEVVVISANI